MKIGNTNFKQVYYAINLQQIAVESCTLRKKTKVVQQLSKCGYSGGSFKDKLDPTKVKFEGVGWMMLVRVEN